MLPSGSPVCIVVCTLASIMPVTALLISEEKSIVKAAYTYSAQTLLLVGVFIALGLKYYWFLIWACTASVTKVFLAPYIIVWAARKTGRLEEIEKPILPRVASVALMVVIVIAGYVIASTYVGMPDTIPLGVSVALTLLGLFLITTRRNLLKQIFGFLYFENGAHLTLAVLAPSIPETIDAGIATDAIVLVLILAVLAIEIHKSLKTLDVSSLTMLKHS